MNALFSYSSSNTQDGSRVKTAYASCGHCGEAGKVAIGSFRSNLDEANQDRIVAAKFERNGWRMGKSRPSFRCPKCLHAAINAAKQKKQEKTHMTVVPMSAPAPKEMSREDGRIIFEKLNDVYDASKYSKDWTDAKVANDLGVPKAWVENVRKQFFGPEGGNEEVGKILASAAELLNEAKQIGGRAETLHKDLRDLLGRAERIEQKVADVQRALR